MYIPPQSKGCTMMLVINTYIGVCVSHLFHLRSLLGLSRIRTDIGVHCVPHRKVSAIISVISTHIGVYFAKPYGYSFASRVNPNWNQI